MEERSKSAKPYTLSHVQSDEESMLMVASGDRQAFEFLFEKYKGPIMGFVAQMTKDKIVAEEITQEVFLKIYRVRGTYRPDAKFTTWLWTIARNATLDLLRKKRESLLEDLNSSESDVPAIEKVESSITDAEAELLARAEKEKIQKCMNGLNDKQREVFGLRIFSDLSHEEISQQIALSVSAVKSLIHRARTALMFCLKASGL